MTTLSIDSRREGIRCHDCPTIKDRGDMFIWHTMVGGHYVCGQIVNRGTPQADITVDEMADHLCGACYLDRVSRMAMVHVVKPSDAAESRAAGGIQ